MKPGQRVKAEIEGVLEHQDGDGSWKVRRDDGWPHVIPEKNLTPIYPTFEVGELVRHKSGCVAECVEMHVNWVRVILPGMLKPATVWPVENCEKVNP